PDRPRKVVRFGIGRAVIGEPLDRLGQFVDQPETVLNAFDHQVADIGAVDATGRRHPGDRLAVAAVEREGDADLLFYRVAFRKKQKDLPLDELRPISMPGSSATRSSAGIRGAGASAKTPMQTFLDATGSRRSRC